MNKGEPKEIHRKNTPSSINRAEFDRGRGDFFSFLYLFIAVFLKTLFNLIALFQSPSHLVSNVLFYLFVYQPASMPEFPNVLFYLFVYQPASMPDFPMSCSISLFISLPACLNSQMFCSISLFISLPACLNSQMFCSISLFISLPACLTSQCLVLSLCLPACQHA